MLSGSDDGPFDQEKAEQIYERWLNAPGKDPGWPGTRQFANSSESCIWAYGAGTKCYRHAILNEEFLAKRPNAEAFVQRSYDFDILSPKTVE